MMILDFKRRSLSPYRFSSTALPVVFLVALSACSDTGEDITSGDGDVSEGSGFNVTTSLSAAQLATDTSITVQTLLSQADVQSGNGAQTPGAPAAANPDTDTDDDTNPESDSDTDTDLNTDTDSTPTESEDTSGDDTAPTSFSSRTTQGFTGEVLDDGIRIQWQPDSGARGYNVYRQAQYYTTVFDTQFLDTDVYDRDYYYEIEAFDQNDRLYYIAKGLTVSARTFGRTDPDAPQPNENLLDNYELVFSDEFTGSELDKSKWNTSFLWGTDIIINDEEQYYVDINNDPDFGFNPFTFDGETITINTIPTPDELASKANNQAYLSGIITSYDGFKFTYGYSEMRAKLHYGRGYWPAFWLLTAYYGGAEPEIDIMEFIGHKQDDIYHTYHYFDSNGELRSTKSHVVSAIDYTADFNTFGVEWKPGELIFYVNGIETKRIRDANVSQEEMYVLANQAVGGWWAGSPDSTTTFPGKYVIDYIRVYQSTVQYDEVQFDQETDLIPLFADEPGQSRPNHKPPFRLWPEGYPTRQ